MEAYTKSGVYGVAVAFFAFIRFLLLGICLLPFEGWHD
jgi:hypothetical protein